MLRTPALAKLPGNTDTVYPQDSGADWQLRLTASAQHGKTVPPLSTECVLLSHPCEVEKRETKPSYIGTVYMRAAQRRGDVLINKKSASVKREAASVLMRLIGREDGTK